MTRSSEAQIRASIKWKKKNMDKVRANSRRSYARAVASTICPECKGEKKSGAYRCDSCKEIYNAVNRKRDRKQREFKNAQPKTLFTTTEVAKQLGVSPYRVRECDLMGFEPMKSKGGWRRYTHEDIGIISQLITSWIEGSQRDEKFDDARYHREWRKKNPDKSRANSKRYRGRHPELKDRTNQYRREYCARNPERIKAITERYRAKNADKILQYDVDRYHRRVANKQCVTCGKPNITNYVCCQDCKEKRNAALKIRREAKRKKNECIVCNNPRINALHCEQCRVTVRAYHRAWLKRPLAP